MRLVPEESSEVDGALGTPVISKTANTLPIAPVPLVIVEGFLFTAGPALWGDFEKHSNSGFDLDGERPQRRVIFASVGPVSSLHDRACELYYALRGGTVDYGATHAQENGHARYGRTHAEGLYPEWSREKPLHFLGHSMGGTTIVKLQWLLSVGFFSEDDHPDMCLSVTSISAPFRGSQAVYTLGESTNNAPDVRTFSVGNIISKCVHVSAYLSPLFPTLVDLHADSRSLACTKSSFSYFLRHLWHSDWAEGHDATPYDVTFKASDEREERMEGLVNPNTFYKSYVACMTRRKSEDRGHHSPFAQHLFTVPGLYALSSSMGSFDFSELSPSPSCICDDDQRTDDPESAMRDNDNNVNIISQREELWANDGVVPLFSQWHPHACRLTRCKHYDNSKDLEKSCSTAPEPGLWHVHHLENATHLSLAPLWIGSARQRAFWGEFGLWMQRIDNTVLD